MIWIYNILLTFTAPFWAPWMIWRAKRRREGVNWKERSGDFSFKLEKGVPRLWLHAVSVGEVVAALPILRAVRAKAPKLEIVLSVTTSSGHQTAREQGDGLFDHLVYYPIDVYRFVLAGLVRVRPSVVAVMETELWMNFLDACKNIGATTLLINGRISDRSFPRARLFKFFYKPLLATLDRCLMQTETDRERIVALGACVAEVFGNCKHDQAVEGIGADPAFWRSELGVKPDRPVVVVGSTRGELEEKFVLDALSGLNVQVVWAPRHLERADALSAECEKRLGRVALRSRGQRIAQDGTTDILVLDTYGELSQVYSIADVVIVGGGFDDLGGQNLIQPLAHGKPVIHGPHMQNFKDVTEAAATAGATMTVSSSIELAGAIREILTSEKLRHTMGKAAAELVKSSLGASDRYADAIIAASAIPAKLD